MERLTGDDPARLGHFELVCRLSAGGMAQVYLATAPDGRCAAVKVLHSSYGADPRFRTRFEREVQTLRALRGSWTVSVLGADPGAARPWLATEYLAAPTLEEVVGAHGGITGGALTTLAGGLAAALAELHGQDVLHRDLKPSNVMLTAKGPRLIDFGISRALDASRLTQTGMVVGTPAYSSPEQALGRPESPASDVFAMALVLGYSATGVGPFGRSDNAVAMLRRIVDDEPNLDGLPETLRAELAGCLAKDPADRPAASALADRLAVRIGLAGVSHWPPPSVRGLVEQRQRETLLQVRSRPPRHPAGSASAPASPGGWGTPGAGSAPRGHPLAVAAGSRGGRTGVPGTPAVAGPPTSWTAPGATPPHGLPPYGLPPYGLPPHGLPPAASAGTRTWLIVTLVVASLLVLASVAAGIMVLRSDDEHGTSPSPAATSTPTS